MTTVTRW